MARAKKPYSTSHDRFIELHRDGMTLWESGTTPSKRHLALWESHDLSWENPEGLAEWFQQTIREYRWKGSVDLLLPRSLVNLHLLDLPFASSDRLRNILPLQMESLYGEKTENTLFDYAPVKIPEASDSTSLVLMATIPKGLLTSLQNVCRLSGLEPHRVLFRDMISRPEWKTTDARMHTFVWLDDQSRTMGLAIGGQVIRTLTIPMTDPLPSIDLLHGFERRLLQSLPVSCREIPRGHRSAILSLSEPPYPHEAIAWTESIGMEHQRVEDIGDLYQEESLGLDGSVHRIDFLHTHPPLKKPRLKGSMVALTALALLAVLILWGYRQHVESASRARLSFLKQRIESVESELASLETPLARYEATRQWQRTRLDWAAELSRLSHSLSVIQNAYLLRLQLDSADGERHARIRMEGRATSVAEATKWNRILSQSSDRYSLQPQSLDASVTDPDYPTQFRVEALILPQTSVARAMDRPEEELPSTLDSSDDPFNLP